MNYSICFYTLGTLLKVEAGLMLLPLLVCFLYGEDPMPFGMVIAMLLVVGKLLTLRRPKNEAMYAKEGFWIVGASWILLSLFGALPFTISGQIPRFVDAFFETVSGFTTTGASILTDVEALTQGILFWRSFTHWVGGMGVLVFVLAVLPKSDAKTMYIMKAEVPGPTCGKLVARVRHTALILYGIYLALTAILTVLLMAGGMPAFDSLVHAFGTAGTGGFGIKGASIGYYDSAYFDTVIGIFMLLFGVNFNLYYFLLLGDFVSVFRNEELRWYLGIVAGAVALITVNILPQYGTVLRSLRYAFFQVASIITTTGYATADFGQWPMLSQTILVCIMFVGAMAGSTGGGLKVARVLLLFKGLRRNIRQMLQPRKVELVRNNGQTVDQKILDNTNAYLAAYVIIIFVVFAIISLDGFSAGTNFSAVLCTFNNIGPGLEAVGPTCNFSLFSPLSKLVLSWAMLAGRLEIFPILVLFSKSTWKQR